MTEYDYRVDHVQRVVDGDTIDLVIDVGFKMTTVQRVRLLGIDTPERGEPGWAEATEFTKNWLDTWQGKIRVETHKTDSFGRYLAYLYAKTDVRRQALNVELVSSGHAKPYVR